MSFCDRKIYLTFEVLHGMMKETDIRVHPGGAYSVIEFQEHWARLEGRSLMVCPIALWSDEPGLTRCEG